MAWNLPALPTAGVTVATVANWATKVIDSLRYLKGLDGVPTIESGLTIDNTDGDERLLLPLLSTAECSTVLNAEGEVAFDEQTHQMKAYDGTAVRVVLSSADVDDTPVNGASTVPISSNWAYDHLATLTTRGDIPYRNATVWARLGVGAAGTYLYSNGTDPSWVAGSIPQYGIIIWTGTIANIPVGFVICDGNNSSPNLLTRFLEGVATAATNPGTTGGATSKTTDGSGTANRGEYAGEASPPHTHIIADIRPLFYDVAYIMKS